MMTHGIPPSLLALPVGIVLALLLAMLTVLARGPQDPDAMA